MSNSISSRGLRFVLVIAGIFIMFTGFNVAFGGILTLGWQGGSNFISVTDQEKFLAQDSHIRFLGGIWFFIGVIFVIAATDLRKYKDILKFAFIAIFAGGLARFIQMEPEVTFGPAILGSLLAEIIGIPVLYFWYSRVTNQKALTQTDMDAGNNR